MSLQRNSKGYITYIEEALEEIEAAPDDWVLIRGTREERPFQDCYFATTVEIAGGGELDVHDTGDVMAFHKIKEIKILGKKGNL